MQLIITLDAIFLFAELALIICLLIPAIPRKSWKETFDSPALKYVSEKCHLIFLLMILILSVPLLISIRDLLKYNQEKDYITDRLKLDFNEELQKKINILITGSCLFLWLVLNKLWILTKDSADMESLIQNLVKSNTILEEKLVEMMNKKPDETITSSSTGTTTGGLIDDDDNDLGRTRSRSKSRASKID